MSVHALRGSAQKKLVIFQEYLVFTKDVYFKEFS